MSSTTDLLIKGLAKTLVETPEKKSAPYDTQAEVRRVEGDIAWVHIPGGVDETPVQLTTNAKKGDIVQIRVSGGRAWLYGNATSPPTDDTVAKKANKTAAAANEHAVNAITSAMLAQQSAEEAQESASIARVVTNEIQQYAQTAEKSVTEILEDAVTARINADSAQESATTALTAANTAQWQLGVIEDVVGTLEWIATHAIYKWTDDTTPETGKWYYSLVATEVITPKIFDLQAGRYYTRSTGYIYIKVINPVVSDIENYYEYNSETGTYFLTQDIEIDETKSYYTRSDSYVYTAVNVAGSIDPMQTYYTVVATAQIVTKTTNPHNSYYYEIMSYDKTVQNYISTHLSLDESGLHLTDGNLMNRMDISAINGVEMWIGGKKVAQYGTSTTIGPTNSYHMEITSEQLSFVTGQGTIVAFMNGEFLSIPRVVVVDSMQIGTWLWDGKSNIDHLTLRWVNIGG